MDNLEIINLYPYHIVETDIWGIIIELPKESTYAKAEFSIDQEVFTGTATWKTISQHGSSLGRGHHDGRVFFTHTAGSTPELPRLGSFSAPRESLTIPPDHVTLIREYSSKELEAVIDRKKTFRRPSDQQDLAAKIMTLLGKGE